MAQQIFIDDGPNVGLSSAYIAISNDGVTWNSVSKVGLNVTSTFVPGAGRNIAMGYPYPNACRIKLNSQGSEIMFDIQDVVNQPWQNANPDLTGNAEIATAIQTINSW